MSLCLYRKESRRKKLYPLFFPLIFMCYSNLKLLDQRIQKRFIDNLLVLLQEYNCGSLETWLENINVLASGRFRVTSDEESTLYCVDEENDFYQFSGD